nr:hypothetical protein [Tanacetum cinerariifolium]
MKHWKSSFFLIDWRVILDAMVWRNPDVVIDDPRPAAGSFNIVDVHHLSAHVIKLRDMPKGVLVFSRLSRVWKNRFYDSVLWGTDRNVVCIQDFLCLPEWAGAEKQKASTFGSASSHVAKRTRSALAQSSGSTTRPSLFAGGDDDACMEILLVTPLHSAAVIPSSWNQGGSSVESQNKGIMVDDVDASSGGDGVAGNCKFTQEEWDAPYRASFRIIMKEVSGLNDKLATSNASFAKSKAKGKKRKKNINSLSKSLNNLHFEVARLSTALNQATILKAKRDEEILWLKATPPEFSFFFRGQLHGLVWKFLASDEFSRVQGELLSWLLVLDLSERLVEASPFIAQNDYAFLNKISEYVVEPLSVILQLEPKKLVRLVNVPIPRDTRVSHHIAKESTVTPKQKASTLGSASSHVAKRTRSALAQSSGSTTRPSLFAGGDDDACVEILLVTPLRSAAVIPSSWNQGGSSVDSQNKGIMVDDVAASSGGDGVAGNCKFTREEWDAPYRPSFRIIMKEMSVLHGMMMMSHGGKLFARYHGLNQSHHEYLLLTDSRLKGYEEKSKAKGKKRKKNINSLSKSLDNLHFEVARLFTALNQATILKAKRDEEILAGFERGLSMHRTKDEFAAMLKKMVNFMLGAQERLVEASPFVAQNDYAFLNKISEYVVEPLSVILQLEPKKLVHLVNVSIPRDTRVSPHIAKESTTEEQVSSAVDGLDLEMTDGAAHSKSEGVFMQGTSYVLDDVAEVTAVGSERVSSGLTDVVVAFFAGEKGDGSAYSSAIEEVVFPLSEFRDIHPEGGDHCVSTFGLMLKFHVSNLPSHTCFVCMGALLVALPFLLLLVSSIDGLVLIPTNTSWLRNSSFIVASVVSTYAFRYSIRSSPSFGMANVCNLLSFLLILRRASPVSFVQPDSSAVAILVQALRMRLRKDLYGYPIKDASSSPSFGKGYMSLAQTLLRLEQSICTFQVRTSANNCLQLVVKVVLIITYRSECSWLMVNASFAFSWPHAFSSYIGSEVGPIPECLHSHRACLLVSIVTTPLLVGNLIIEWMVKPTASRLLIPVLPIMMLYDERYFIIVNSISTVLLLLSFPKVTRRSITPRG